MLKTGMIIAERYEILGKIGTGGMADVYKAKDHKLNRFVAVKVLKSEFREDATFVKKFRSEAQAAAVLTHPNIVNVFDVGDDEGVYYIVMELIEGITLKEYISKKGKLSVKEATSIAIQVSMGLEAAHSHGIVHRDVKPQNIIISTDGKVKVTDFGIARAASSNTISSNVMGSVHYSSPEQVRGGYSDEKSDIYSLGITLYEMVTGRVPFDGDTTVAIAIKHLQEEMVPPSIYAPDLPYSLEQIIFKCTQKSVDRRYSQMEDVIADLKHSLIDPQGDFVRLTSVDNDAKTVVISDKELGEIKHTPKQAAKPDLEALEKEIDEMSSYDEGAKEEEERKKRDKERERERVKRAKRRKKQRNNGIILTIAALIAGAALLVVLIFIIGRAAGLMGGGDEPEDPQQEQTQQVVEDDGMVEVPSILGMTEEEAKAALSERSLGLQSLGDEPSTQPEGRISSQDIAAGTSVEKNSTVKYYVSRGAVEVTVPDVTGSTGIDAQQRLEDEGLVVQVQRIYSELDYNGYPMVDPGYAYYTEPAAGAAARSGDTVTLYVSRGVDYGDGAQVPNVVGMQKNEALTTLGKFIDIRVNEQMSGEVAAGEVISQDPEGYTYADPDLPMTITVSTGNQQPGEDPIVSDTGQTASPAGEAQAAAAGEVWKCTQRLNTPAGYSGGPIRLELVQEVGGEPTASVVVDGQQLTFPYQLDVTGAPGVSEGTLYLSEQVGGSYQELGHYLITFEKAE
ncbi:MAG: Stk1 family PASTA domain-containing Ser/Thr kinase [Eubacteriales bacterium]|nr:Stk1 family PASTA domain-containing Ser/Thr kinase [Eubacteriales bacterium]